jgi:predicted phosphohydrolase
MLGLRLPETGQDFSLQQSRPAAGRLIRKNHVYQSEITISGRCLAHLSELVILVSIEFSGRVGKDNCSE